MRKFKSPSINFLTLDFLAARAKTKVKNKQTNIKQKTGYIISFYKCARYTSRFKVKYAKCGRM